MKQAHPLLYPVLTCTLLAMAVCPALAQIPSQPPPLRLTLEQAIKRGWQKNLRVLLVGEDVYYAEATRERARALLLPKVAGESGATVQNRSLRAFGITGPGIPNVVGPFSTYDFRVYVQQPLFDLSAYHLWRASGHQQEAAQLNLEDAREVIARVVSGLYLAAQATEARSEAARTRVSTAESLAELARSRREEGVATGVDVLRAEVSLANERQRLLETENHARQALLDLARTIGVELAVPLQLAEPLAYEKEPLPILGEAVAVALTQRADFLSLERQWQAVVEEKKSVESRKLPRFDLRANYGGIGRNLSEIDATGAVQATLSVSLFDRDRSGEIAQIESRLRKLDHQRADLRVAIEQDIRVAMMTLESAAQQVEVARQGRDLAERELELARTRFETGVTNNIEVISAQESVARAQENLILALTGYTDARAALRRALGRGAAPAAATNSNK